MSDPTLAWQRLQEGNDRQVAFHRLAARTCPPHAAVFRCAEADAASDVLLGHGAGSLIDVSTWGHVIDVGVLATMEHAVDGLGVPLIVILGHEDCSAIQAAIRAWNDISIPDGATRVAIEQAMSSIVRRRRATEMFDDVCSSHILEVGLALMQRSPVIARRIDSGECGIVCATTDPSDGRIRVHGTMGAIDATSDALLERV
ncbi:MAG: hypothetical protein K0U76_13890 [Actinomycetia bacterium]|nr:hypothetical protein [Actinomycetes bacterium]MCH9702442.1 hypothetical protein [Actinomycetes bacterium]MCH9761811.1 hypothetical protein [Actinomycetes bacterium]